MRASVNGSRTIVRLGVVDSTQRVAFDLADEGAADGTVVVAETQTAGRGRRGRVWRDERGASLLFSIVVRPALSSSLLPTLSLATAVAVATALERVARLPARLKWPNDVMVNGRKIAGILLESRMGASESRGGVRPVVAVGIGINVLQREFPDDVQPHATSIRLETDRLVSRENLLATLLEEFAHWRAVLERQGFAPVRRRWLALSDTVGRRVRIDGCTGTAIDLDAAGALVIEEAGQARRVIAGDVIADHREG